MPLNRYQLRNEYSLADPELYRAADKDDPEALLEGVAMAGLVGVLRQLGDLAEFAAEIFHDLHEEVMVTAARGHSLIVRVQQLEAEFPTIEKAFLSQTNHSSFFYNSGLDWHPNLRMDQSMITQGDLPRFVMDSYEECRGPPRLFLLDKFDVAGAGACLKRYSDPSFFKVEPSTFGITGTDVHREKKARKAKKKGSRWRNGETLEALPTPHAKLHQLFLEERIQNGISDPARQVKLKRRLNGFPFTSKSGKSYMETFLMSPSPDHEEVHEISVDPLTYESALEIAKISTVSPEKELHPRSISLSSSPAKEETLPGLFEDKLNEVPSGSRDSVMLQPHPDLESYDISDSGVEAYNIPSDLQMEDSEKEIAVDDESKTDDSVDDYQSEDIASEIDNYLDALTIMESEIDTDTEFKTKNDLHYLNKREARGLDASDVQLQAHSSDSQSMGNSTLSDDGNSMSKKETSSYSYSDTHSTAAENTASDGEVSCNIFSSTTETHETEIIGLSLDPQPINKENPLSHPAGGAVLDGLSSVAAKSPTHSSEIGDEAANLSDSDSSCGNTEAFTKESADMFTETDKIVTNPSLNIPLIPNILEATEQSDYHSQQRLPCENPLLDESEGGDKDTSEILPGTSFLCVSSDSKDDFQPHLLAGSMLVNELNDEDVNQVENVASMTNQDLNDNGPPHINHENLSLLSPDDQSLDELHGEDLNLSKSPPIASNISDSRSQLRDDLPVVPSAESLPVQEMVDEYLSSSVDGLSNMAAENNLPVKEVVDEYPSSSVDGLSNMAAENKSGENLVDCVSECGTSKDLNMLNLDDNQIAEQNFGMLLTDVQPLGQTHSSDEEPGDISKIDDVIQAAGEADNVASKEDNSGALVEPLVSEISAEVLPIRSSEEQTSCNREVYLDEPLDTEDGAETSEAVCNSNLSERDSSVEPLLLDGNHVEFDDRDTNSVNAIDVFSGPANNSIGDDDGSSGDLKTSRDVCDSDPVGEVKELITEEACLLESPAESGATEGFHQQIFSLQGSNSGFGQLVDNDQSESELQIPNDGSGTCLPLEVNDNLDATTATPIQSSFKQDELEFSHTEDEFESLTNQLDHPHVFEANSEVITDVDQTQYQKHIDHVGPFGSSSNFVPVKLHSEPSETEFSLQGSNKINISEPLVYPSSSILSSFSPLPDASQIYADEMPPMPPLPPVQWRMTRFQHAPLGQERASVQSNASALPPLFPSKADQDTQPVNQLLSESILGDDNSHAVTSHFPSVVHQGDLKESILHQQGMQYGGILQLPGSEGEILQNSFQDEEIENERSRLNSSTNFSLTDTASASASASGLPHEVTEPLNQEPRETSLNEKELMQSISVAEENVVISEKTTLPSKPFYGQPEQGMLASTDALGLSNQKLTRPLNQETAETSNEEKELGSSPGHLEETLVSCDNNSVSAKTENQQPQHAMSTSEATLVLPVGEENKTNGLRQTKLPRPRNPLIDAVAAHDKSKLRKVTERARPQIQEGERDSLLEQIRTKSFNLKPAVVTRPSIPGPTTNLKVAAILEKAKTIRQAFAGSDEDDDDCWSDS